MLAVSRQHLGCEFSVNDPVQTQLPCLGFSDWRDAFSKNQGLGGMGRAPWF